MTAQTADTTTTSTEIYALMEGLNDLAAESYGSLYEVQTPDGPRLITREQMVAHGRRLLEIQDQAQR
jgi:hypothetical protein